MEFNIEVRKNQLVNLEQFISSSRDQVKAILKSFQWSIDKVKKETTLVSCPIDSNHKMSSKILDKHISKCSLQNEGYDLKEEFLSIPDHKPGQYIQIDNEKKKEIFTKAESKGPFTRAWNGHDPEPRTANRLVCTYSSDERLAMYDYVVNNTGGPPSLPEFNVVTVENIDDKKDLSSEELMALERDAKRRRIKYKSIYTNHKSNTEVMKEVIDGQMVLYEDWISNKSKEQRVPSPSTSQKSLEIDLNERSTISRNSTRSSSSKSTNRRHDNCNNGTEKRSFKEHRHHDNHHHHTRKRRRSRSNNRSRSHHSARRHSRDYHSSKSSSSKRNGYKS